MRSPARSVGTPGPRATSGSRAGLLRSGPLVTRTPTDEHVVAPPWQGASLTSTTVASTSRAGTPRSRAGRTRWWGQSTTRPTTVATAKGSTAAARRRCMRPGRAAGLEPSPEEPAAIRAFCWRAGRASLMVRGEENGETWRHRALSGGGARPCEPPEAGSRPRRGDARRPGPGLRPHRRVPRAREADHGGDRAHRRGGRHAALEEDHADNGERRAGSAGDPGRDRVRGA